MSETKLTVRDFFRRFPDDQACLDHILTVRYGDPKRFTCPKCGVVDATHHKVSERRAYACAACGNHLYPCAGTIFEDSRTPLQLWFYATYLFVNTRNGVSGKELQRQLGVTYKTAWRMGQQIRLLMAKADVATKLRGHVEADDGLIGGFQTRKAVRDGAPSNKTVVLGMAERGGSLRMLAMPDAKQETLQKALIDNIEQGAVVTTDKATMYARLRDHGFNHGTVHHYKEHVRFDPEINEVRHTNNVESFWRLFKNAVASTHIHVSRKYMDRYLKEFTFRANNRAMGNAMFDLLIAAV